MSGSGSAEVSVPTDLTVTSEGDSEDVAFATSRRQAREVHLLQTEQAELRRLVEKLRLELQSRESQLLATKVQCKGALDRITSRHENMVAEKNVHIKRLEAQVQSQQEELQKIKERAATELAHLVGKCNELKMNQVRLGVKHEEIMVSLDDLHMTTEEYEHLRDVPKDQLSLKQYVALRVYECVWPLQMKNSKFEATKLSLEASLSSAEKELSTVQTDYGRVREEICHLVEKLDVSTRQCQSLREDLRTEDFRVRNFDRIKAERDSLEERVSVLSQQGSGLELELKSIKSEKAALEERMNELKERHRKQEEELSEYLHNSAISKSYLDRLKDELTKTCSLLQEERLRSNEVHEKFVKSRGEITKLSELNDDLATQVKHCEGKLQSLTSNERSLREKVNELLIKNEKLTFELEGKELRYDKEKKTSTLEVQELQAMFDSLSRAHKEVVQQKADLMSEVHSTKRELMEVQLQKDQEVNMLKGKLEETAASLSEYQKLQQEYKASINAIASLSEDKAKQYFESILPGLKIASQNASEENITLTRKLIKMERECAQLNDTHVHLKEEHADLQSLIQSYKSALCQASQPTASLLEKIACQHEQINSLQKALDVMRQNRDSLNGEVESLRNDLSAVLAEVKKSKSEHQDLDSVKEYLRVVKDILSRSSSLHPVSPAKVDSSRPGERQKLPKAVCISRAKRKV